MADEPATRSRVTVGLLAAPGLPHQLAADLQRELPAALNGDDGHSVDWQIELSSEPFSDPISGGELVEAARNRLLEEEWQLVVCLTNLPLRIGHRPVTAHASAQSRVGLVSVPALGVVGLARRVLRASVHVIEGLLGESVGRKTRDGRGARIAGRLGELGSPLGRARVHDEGTIGFTTAVVRGNLRLLRGMVRANNPALVIARMSRALVGALGADAVALASANVWTLAVGMTWPRLLGVSIATLATTCFALVAAHHLWERSRRREEREQVVLFNLATVLTVLLSVLALYLALYAVTLFAAAVLIPPKVLEHDLGHAVGVTEYLKLAWLVSSMASIGGALGSMVESDLSVREAMYRARPDERTETDRGAT